MYVMSIMQVHEENFLKILRKGRVQRTMTLLPRRPRMSSFYQQPPRQRENFQDFRNANKNVIFLPVACHSSGNADRSFDS